jgi:hypothetical protein
MLFRICIVQEQDCLTSLGSFDRSLLQLLLIQPILLLLFDGGYRDDCDVDLLDGPIRLFPVRDGLFLGGRLVHHDRILDQNGSESRQGPQGDRRNLHVKADRPLAGFRKGAGEFGVVRGIEVLKGGIVQTETRRLDQKAESLKDACQQETGPHAFPASVVGTHGSKEGLDNQSGAQHGRQDRKGQHGSRLMIELVLKAAIVLEGVIALALSGRIGECSGYNVFHKQNIIPVPSSCAKREGAG